MNNYFLRIGKVTTINISERMVRVYFPDVNIVSDWLKVVSNTPSVVRTGETAGGTGEESFELHSHSVDIKHFMPEINDTVLCIYMPGFNSDGYVLGVL